jgi:ABC transporter substrate binding protein
MRRREFMTLLGGTAVAWPLPGGAAGHLPRIGVLDINSAETNVRNLAAFRDGLRGLGYIEGSTVDIDYRYSDGDTDRLPALALELVQLRPDVVLAVSVSPARAVKRIAPTMPIVCPSFGDAFVPSLAASFAHPGGSVTGIATEVEGLFGKLTELTLDAIPGATKIGFLANPTGASMPHYEEAVQFAAQARSVEVQVEPVRKLDDFDEAFQRFSDGHGSPTSCATGVSAGRRCLVWRRKRGEAGRASFANTCDRRETRQSDGITEQHGLQRTSATKSARTGLSDNSASPSRLSLLLQPHYFQISHHLSDLVSQILRHSACWASQDALSGPPSSGCGLIHSA